jgi:hypothetical protein
MQKNGIDVTFAELKENEVTGMKWPASLLPTLRYTIRETDVHLFK